MANKRKKGQAAHVPQKRAKSGRAKQPAASSQEYRIRTILEETKTHYRIDWEDAEDGERFEPTWEPKRYANAQAVADWEAQKAAKTKATSSATTTTPPVKSRGRPRKVINSSPTSPVVPNSTQKPTETVHVRAAVLESSATENEPQGKAASPGIEDQPLEVAESQPEPEQVADTQLAIDSQLIVAAESPLFEPEDVVEAAVNATAPPSSFEAGAYQVFSSSQRLQNSIGLSGEASAEAPLPEEAEPLHVASTDSQATTAISGGAECEESVIEVSQPSQHIVKGSDLTEDKSTERVPPGGEDISAAARDTISQNNSSASQPQHHIKQKSTSPEQASEEHQASGGAAKDNSAAAVTSPEVPAETPKVTATSPPGPVAPVQATLNSSSLVTHVDRKVEPISASKGRRQVPSQTSVSFSAFDSSSSFPFQTQISIVPRASSLSALDSVPTHSIAGVLGDSAPPRPQTPSTPLSFDMAAMQPLTGSIGEQLSALRAKRRQAYMREDASAPASPVARLRAEENTRRSPSVVPAVEVEEPVTQEEMNTSERYKTLVPREQEQSNGSKQITRPEREPHTLTKSHMVPIALMGHQRDQYPSTIAYCQEPIQRFLEMNQPDDELTSQVVLIMDKLRHIALHPDLANPETFTQSEPDPRAQAQWDVDCSAKFRFLNKLLEDMRDEGDHVIIVAEDDHIMAKLDTFLTGWRIPHQRGDTFDGTGFKSDEDGLMVTLLALDSVDDDDVKLSTGSADVLIAMSPPVGRTLDDIRKALVGRYDCPTLTLVIPYTVEHVDLQLSASLSPQARLKALVRSTYRLRYDAGTLEEDQSKVEDAAHAIAMYLSKESTGQEVEFPIAGLTTIHNLDSQTESDVSSGVHKRPLESDLVMESSKRIRPNTSEGLESELPTTINPQDIEITHISDSVSKPTQSQPSSLNDIEQGRQKLLEQATARVEELDEAMGKLQFRHEEQREELIKVANERAAAIMTAEQALARYTETANSASKLKVRYTELKEQLDSANARLLNHDVPERAELEAARLEAEQSKADNVKLRNQLEKVQNDLDYTRSLYQNASQQASGLATQNTELEGQLATSQQQATGEHARLRQMGYDAQTKNLRVENRRLKALLLDREAGLKFRDEEIARLKEASRGRMGTRGTSIPRSPRLGSPMKSRQGSPAAGELKGKSGPAHLHPLRNG